MNIKEEKLQRRHELESSSYRNNLWNYLKNNDDESYVYLDNKNLVRAGAPFMDADSMRYFKEKLTEKSVVRKLATIFMNEVDSSTIATFPNKAMATWSKSGEQDLYSNVLELKDVNVKFDYNTLSSLITIHEDFLNDPNTGIKNIMLNTLAQGFAKAEDNAFVNGTGKGEPLGLLNVADLKTVQAKQSLTIEDLKKLFFSLDNDYRENAKWLLNDKTALYLQTLKDGQGNFLWNHYDGTFMGKEVLISNFMPDIDAGSKPITFGDYSNYWIIERQVPTIKRLFEYFILKNHVGFIGREYLDAELVDKESVVILNIEG